MQEMWVQSLGQEDPLEEEMATHSIFLCGRPQGQSSQRGYSPWGRKDLDTTERLNTLFLSFLFTRVPYILQKLALLLHKM